MRAYEFLVESMSSIEIDNDRYDETEEINSQLHASNWKQLVSSAFTTIFSELYPSVKLNIINSNDGMTVSTGNGSYHNNDNNEFIAEILYPGAFIGMDGKIYVGLEIDSVVAGQYKGVITRVLFDVNNALAKSVNGYPAFISSTPDESGGVWRKMCQKFGWPYINEVD